MEREELIKIFKADSGKWEGDNAFQGLKILSKYTHNLIHGADHDVIWSESIDVLLENGLTREDAIKLREINWMIEENTYMACFV